MLDFISDWLYNLKVKRFEKKLKKYNERLAITKERILNLIKEGINFIQIEDFIAPLMKDLKIHPISLIKDVGKENNLYSKEMLKNIDDYMMKCLIIENKKLKMIKNSLIDF